MTERPRARDYRRDVTNSVVGACTYAEFFGCAVAFLPIMAGARLLHAQDRTRRVPGRWMRRFGRTTSALTPLWKFSVEGPVPADIDRRGYVVVSNHESTADPFLLSWLPWDMRWVAKEELFHLPLIGWLMRLGGDIPLRRGDRSSSAAMFEECLATLTRGCSVMIFPEGTRSPDGRLLPFKDGAFKIAIEAGAPVLPIAISGTRECRPKGSLWFGRATARARILPPIPTAGLQSKDVAMLRELTRGRIADALHGPAITPSQRREALAPSVRA